jgi:DnaJ-class molecular chaperone
MSSIASDKFRALTQAFSVLSDTQLRKIYDHFGEEGLNETQKATINGSGDHTFKQVFNNNKIKSEKPIKSSTSHSINGSKVDSKVFINNFFILKYL